MKFLADLDLMVTYEHWHGFILAMRRLFTRCEGCHKCGWDRLRMVSDWYSNKRLLLCDDCMAQNGMRPEKYARYEGE